MFRAWRRLPQGVGEGMEVLGGVVVVQFTGGAACKAVFEDVPQGDAAVRGDDTFEVIDGQQRTLSLCKFTAGDFSVPWRGSVQFFGNLQDDEQRRVLDYRLMVYLCEGSDTEKLEWFRTINIAGEELTAQELRNAVYPTLKNMSR